MKTIVTFFVNLLYEIGVLSPLHIAKLKYFYKLHKWPNFKSPKNLNEKINWLKFYGDTSKWADLADKYKVRDYVKSKGLENTLVKLYGKWDNPKDIIWETLPNQFVLKVNNGCGDVLICRDKSDINIPKVVSEYSKLMSTNYGVVSGEPHYAEIKPCIIAEELLDISKQSIPTSSLIDYKVWCLNGEPYLFFCCWNRNKFYFDCGIYDINWNYREEYGVYSNHIRKGDERIPKPDNLDEIISVAKMLSEGFPIVRVDLYNVNGKVYFGEMTFTSLGGAMDYFTPELLREMGNKVKL